MRKLLMASAAVLTLAVASPALADNAGLGAAAGATTGGTLGFIFGGPIGAIVGGFSGAVVGSAAADADVTYAGNHPVDPIYLDDQLDVGYKVGGDVKLYPIEGDASHSYFYANNRVWIVDSATGEITSSPGYVVPDRAVTYIRANPTASITVSGDVAPGFRIGTDVTLHKVPDVNGYGYVYIDNQPVLVDSHSHMVVWAG